MNRLLITAGARSRWILGRVRATIPGILDKFGSRLPAKAWLLIIPFFWAAYISGATIRRFSVFYSALYDNPLGATLLFAWIMFAMILLSLSGTIIGLLVRPLPAAFAVMAIGAVLYLLSWEFSGWAATGGLAFLAYGSYFLWSLNHDLQRQVRFSVMRASRYSARLLIALSLSVCLSSYPEIVARIATRGVEIPQSIWLTVSTAAEHYTDVLIPESLRTAGVNPDTIEFATFMETVMLQSIEPYLQLVPLAIAIGVYFLMRGLNQLMATLAGLLLAGILPFLEAWHYVKFSTVLIKSKKLTPVWMLPSPEGKNKPVR